MTRGNGATPRGVMRQHLADQKDFPAPAGYGRTQSLLCATVAVPLARVD